MSAIKERFHGLISSFLTDRKLKDSSENVSSASDHEGYKPLLEEEKEGLEQSMLTDSWDPLDKQAFYDRVETYNIMSWFGKPLELSPLVCARYGWQNTERDLIRCVSCKAVVCGQLPNAWDISLYKTCCRKLEEKLKTAHEVACKWISCPSPESLLRIELHNKEEVVEGFLYTVKALCQIGEDLPVVSHVSLVQQGVDSYMLDSLTDSIRDRVDAVEASILYKAVTLTLCGWTVRSNKGENSLLVCDYCRRHIGVWNYKGSNSLEENDFEEVGTGQQDTTAINIDNEESTAELMDDVNVMKKDKLGQNSSDSSVKECVTIEKSDNNKVLTDKIRTKEEGIQIKDCDSDMPCEKPYSSDSVSFEVKGIVPEISIDKMKSEVENVMCAISENGVDRDLENDQESKTNLCNGHDRTKSPVDIEAVDQDKTMISVNNKNQNVDPITHDQSMEGKHLAIDDDNEEKHDLKVTEMSYSNKQSDENDVTVAEFHDSTVKEDLNSMVTKNAQCSADTEDQLNTCDKTEQIVPQTKEDCKTDTDHCDVNGQTDNVAQQIVEDSDIVESSDKDSAGEQHSSPSEPPKKKFKLVSKESLDPLLEHRTWCPWINCFQDLTSSVTRKICTPSGSRRNSLSRYESDDSANKSLIEDSGLEEAGDGPIPPWKQRLYIVCPALKHKDELELSLTDSYKKGSPSIMRAIRSVMKDWV